MQLLAEALRRKGVNARSVAFNADFRKFKNDCQVPKQVIPIRRFVNAVDAIREFDVFHFFWGVSLFDFWRFHGLDLPILKWMGKKVVVHFRGTDIVNVKYYDYLLKRAQGDVGLTIPPISRPDQQRKLEKWKKYADLILVSTPDLLTLTGPGAVLIPQVLDCERWKLSQDLRAGGDRKVVRVAHAPTRRIAKGTKILVDAIDELKRKGLPVELDLIEDLSYNEMRKALSRCDIGVDQLLHGWYGKVSVEFMALGKPVVCYIDSSYAAQRSDLPIVNASPNNLALVLERLVLDEPLRISLGQQSLEYVKKYHDVDSVANELLVLYSRL